MVEQLEVIRDPHLSLTDSQYEKHLEVWGETHTFSSLREPIQQTPYWTSLVGLEPRYSRFHSGRIDPAEFIELMGHDVVPQLHGPYQARTIAIPLIEAQQECGHPEEALSRELFQSFVAYHVLHDDHEGEEARLRGDNADLPHPLKTAETEAAEFTIWTTIHQELFLQNATSEIAKIKEITAHKTWDISERLGYLATGLQAAHVARHNTEISDSSRKVFRQLARGVVERQVPVIEQARNSIALADIILMQTVETRREIATWESLT